MCRVGLAVPGAFHARHFHPTVAHRRASPPRPRRASSIGSTEDQLVHAFGICGSQAGGIIEYLADGSWTKRLHPGWARPRRRRRRRRSPARASPDPRRVLEGEHGFYAAFAGGARRRAARRAARQPRPRVGARPAHLQAVPVRLDRPAVHGLRAAAPRAARRAPRGHRRDPLPHRRRDRCRGSGSRSRPSTRPRTATPRSSACPICSRSILVARPRRPRRVHGRRRARRGGARGGRAGRLRARSDHRLPAPVRRPRRGPPDRRPRARGAPGSSARRPRLAA